MFLTICVYDSSIDNLREKLNALDDCGVYDSSVDKFWESMIFSIDLLYSQIVKNIQPFSEIINRNMIFTNRQEHSTLLRNDQHNYHIHKSSRSFNSSLILSTEPSYTQIVKIIHLLYMIFLLIVSEKSWMFLKFCVYDSSIDVFREELNLFSEVINSTIIYTNRQDHSTVLWYYQ
jgi:hypothetical protein